MNRPALATAAATALLALAALEAAAAPASTGYTRPYWLACTVTGQNVADEGWKIEIRNDSGRIVPKGARIVIFMKKPGYGQSATATETAAADIAVNGMIRHYANSKSIGCSAKVELPRIDPKLIRR
jgi:hypothetical protein